MQKSKIEHTDKKGNPDEKGKNVKVTLVIPKSKQTKADNEIEVTMKTTFI